MTVIIPVPAPEPWAVPEDVRARRGSLSSQELHRCKILIEDATQYVKDIAPTAAYRPAATLRRVICNLVIRALAQPDPGMPGVETLQQTAGPFSATIRPVNPSGDFYLTKQERAVLGLNKQTASSIDLLAGGAQ